LGGHDSPGVVVAVDVDDQPTGVHAVLATKLGVCHQMRAKVRDGLERPDAALVFVAVSDFE
jgi:hypothetical protein